VSATEKAIGVVKTVLLFTERLEAIQKQMDQLRGDLAALSRDVIDVDRRVTRIEGVMEGFQRASATTRRPRLPKK
jgi:hypothetical protein